MQAMHSLGTHRLSDLASGMVLRELLKPVNTLTLVLKWEHRGKVSG